MKDFAAELKENVAYYEEKLKKGSGDYKCDFSSSNKEMEATFLGKFAVTSEYKMLRNMANEPLWFEIWKTKDNTRRHLLNQITKPVWVVCSNCKIFVSLWKIILQIENVNDENKYGADIHYIMLKPTLNSAKSIEKSTIQDLFDCNQSQCACGSERHRFLIRQESPLHELILLGYNDKGMLKWETTFLNTFNELLKLVKKKKKFLQEKSLLCNVKAHSRKQITYFENFKKQNVDVESINFANRIIDIHTAIISAFGGRYSKYKKRKTVEPDTLKYVPLVPRFPRCLQSKPYHCIRHCFR
jgi:hypothetical protein